MQNWFVVYTAPQAEIRASMEIARENFEVFYPLKQFMRRERNRPPRKIVGPLFPRYIFARFDREYDSWGRINDLRGVCCVLCNDNTPVLVRNEIMEAIRSYREPEQAVVEIQNFQMDQPVKVTSGILCGIEGLFKGTDRQRTKAFMEILGKKYTLPLDTIAAA